MSNTERRLCVRIPIERPCKVFRRGTQRYVPAVTRDVSASGALLEIRAARPVIAGEKIDVGVAWSRSPIMLEDALMEAKVVRATALDDERQSVAVAFESAVELAQVA
ncbi:MAG: PilZ domain-containing protein [Phycisphaerales bacterium]